MAKPVGFCPRGLPAWARIRGFGQGGLKHRFTLIFFVYFFVSRQKSEWGLGQSPNEHQAMSNY
jgi:hypothetical protein